MNDSRAPRLDSRLRQFFTDRLTLCRKPGGILTVRPQWNGFILFVAVGSQNESGRRGVFGAGRRTIEEPFVGTVRRNEHRASFPKKGGDRCPEVREVIEVLR